MSCCQPLLSTIKSGTQGAGLALSLGSAIANIGHLSSLASSALKPYFLAMVVSIVVRVPVKACSGLVLNVQLVILVETRMFDKENR